MQFKKLYRDETIFLENGYATNGKWCVSVSWLGKHKRRDNMQLRRRVSAATVAAVTARLSGEEHATKPIREAILDKFPGDEFSGKWSPVDLSAAQPVEGYYRGNPERREIVAYQVPAADGKTVSLDAEYFCALLWDSALTLYVRGETDPIYATVTGEIVFVCAPLRPSAVHPGMEID